VTERDALIAKVQEYGHKVITFGEGREQIIVNAYTEEDAARLKDLGFSCLPSKSAEWSDPSRISWECTTVKPREEIPA
jgi:hypothetical protein